MKKVSLNLILIFLIIISNSFYGKNSFRQDHPKPRHKGRGIVHHKPKKPKEHKNNFNHKSRGEHPRSTRNADVYASPGIKHSEKRKIKAKKESKYTGGHHSGVKKATKTRGKVDKASDKSNIYRKNKSSQMKK